MLRVFLAVLWPKEKKKENIATACVGVARARRRGNRRETEYNVFLDTLYHKFARFMGKVAKIKNSLSIKVNSSLAFHP